MRLLAHLCVTLSFLEGVRVMCPSQCSCEHHGRSDDSGSRVVLCDDLDMTEVPTNLPVDTVKLRIEKTAVRQLPAEAFYYLVELQFLWVTYNTLGSLDTSSFYNLKQLHELRLAGNALTAFPWAALRDMPQLRSLDLHNNRIASVPLEATGYLKSLAYLDLSSNRLATLPPDFLESWAHSVPLPRSRDLPRRAILGLQDNPWLCDCHISKVIELSKVADPTVVLLDPLMVCSEPERLAGITFQRAELEQCQKLSVMTSATQITSVLGSNVLLRCDATGAPTPQLTWTRADSLPVNSTVIQESPEEGVRWSIISLTSISHKHAGDYKCQAKNLAGTSEAVVTVMVVSAVTTTESSDTSRGAEEPPAQLPPESRNSTAILAFLASSWPPSSPTSPTLSAFNSSPASTASLSSSPSFSSTTPSAATLRARRPTSSPPASQQDGKGPVKVVEPAGNKLPSSRASKKEGLELQDRVKPLETSGTVGNLRVFSRTRDSVTLMWDVANSTQSQELTVQYFRPGDQDPLLLPAHSSQEQVTIAGLEPGQQYVACVCPKGVPPRQGQCVTFSTEGGGAGSLLVAVGGTACVLLLLLIFLLLYKVCSLQCKSDSLWDDDLAKETYVQFETLSPRSQSLGELWTRRHRDDSEKLLLCSRPSVDSQRTCTDRSGASRLEHCH
ncbi:leucine-rich repeat, immunoglobulin-like domain and transmembrane domain-containing protein 3 isoform X1 [Erinaceus europaeus]|uniref:leucine-rich repeat, immunoglobulin-like domain and transmembrane domain-containing protein 3 isoform X1 n=1 Tax=Erinaceus europaeus TaxID=9365 RepID=UPI0028FCED5B|nr:leucine-rich repeat, immunoglobulin-like domain and transmembrane domain-containing protein 3 isoform X1 [Erinaceus europaeus]